MSGKFIVRGGDPSVTRRPPGCRVCGRKRTYVEAEQRANVSVRRDGHVSRWTGTRSRYYCDDHSSSTPEER